MLQNLKKRNDGFTIIEVLIVLAIAGLIMVIVFLAVPALNRNSRNNQRKTEVNNTLAAISEYANNNGGTLPATGTPFTDALKNVKLNFYSGKVTLTTTTTNPNDVTAFTIVNGAVCATSSGVQTGDADTTTASARQFVALFTVESGGNGKQKLCQEG